VRDIELFRFTAAGTHYRYYTAETPGLYTSNWEPEAIQRRSIKQSQDASKGEIVVSVPLDNPVAQLLVDDAPQPDISLKIWEADIDDIAGTITQVWEGKVRTVKKSGDGWDLPCIAEADRNDASIPRGRFSSDQCRHALYSRGCGVNKADHAKTATVNSVDADNLEVQLQFDSIPLGPDGLTSITVGWLGGIVEGPTGLTAPIVDQGLLSGGGDGKTYDLILGYWIKNLSPGDSITAYRGCNHRMGQCDSVFDNIARFGGFPQLPDTEGTGVE
jgi:hypothetical protein